MAQYDDIDEEARAAYRASRFRDAALLWRRAAASAIELGDRHTWHRMTVWAAGALHLAGRYQEALALLLDARHQQPDNAAPFETWMALKKRYEILSQVQPQQQRPKAILGDLRDYAKEHAVPAGDLPYLEGDMSFDTGDYARALDRFEVAWQQYDGSGYVNLSFATDAALACLRLDRLSSAHDWIEALSQITDEYQRQFIAVAKTQCQIELALAEAAPADKLAALLRTFTDQVLVTQSPGGAETLRKYTVRINLLEPSHGDPADPLHPARAELRRTCPHPKNVHYRFDARLLFVDYRLACLRYAAGLPPVDDKYHRHAVAASAATRKLHPGTTRSLTEADIALRIHKARAAADWAMVYARKLDGWLECDRRQVEVRKRRERIEAIVQSLRMKQDGPGPEHGSRG